MKHCDNCGVDVRGTDPVCPLCQAPLSGTDEPPVWPVIPTVYSRFRLFFKILGAATAAAGIISLAVNLMVPQSGFWSLFVVAGLVCLWLCLALAIRKRHKIPRNILTQVVLISLLSLLWDLGTGFHGWSVDYVIPILCIAAMIAVAVVSQVLHMAPSDYLFSMMTDALFGVVPLILYLTGHVTVIYPSICCAALSILSFVTLLIFQGRAVYEELAKRFHI